MGTKNRSTSDKFENDLFDNLKNTLADTKINNRLENIHQQTPFTCDYDLIVKNVNELNSLMSDANEPRIVEYESNRMKFTSTSGSNESSSNSIRLKLYANGICLFNGPFRSFNDSLTKKFCIDIMDGYFPTELQDRYPDGVNFELVDKRDVIFKQNELINSVFKSKGYRLGSGRVDNSLSTSDGNLQIERSHDKETITNEEDFYNRKTIETHLVESPLTVEEFLKKLPSKVVRNSNIIDVKRDIQNILEVFINYLFTI